ncbi:MAG: LytTR family DNA-binding domain-containing protein [Lachnospiraceae bacterium]|nr:LytTR family DNA-binding domain-containing protein [Lachnospiraceae bacterium]
MDILNIAVCDDEQVYRESMVNECMIFFREYNSQGFFAEVPKICCFSSGRELIASGQEYDILFLDIEMPEQDGISIKDYFEERHGQTRIIFMTCHEERVMEAFGKNVVSFLVKPLDVRDFRRVLAKTLDDIRGQVLELEENGEQIFILVRQIKYIEAQDKYTAVVTEKGRYLFRRTMKFWEEMLPHQDFCRIHKSYLLNLDYFEKTGDMVILDTDKTVKLSRGKKQEIVEQYKEYLRRKVRMM